MKIKDEKNKCPTNNTLAVTHGTNIPQVCHRCEGRGYEPNTNGSIGNKEIITRYCIECNGYGETGISRLTPTSGLLNLRENNYWIKYYGSL